MPLKHCDHPEYQYEPTNPTFGIGTQNLAFHSPSIYHPSYSVTGFGVSAGYAPNPFTPVQLYVTAQALPSYSPGGVTAGGLYTSPLYQYGSD